jgi:hypothetical protein
MVATKNKKNNVDEPTRALACTRDLKMWEFVEAWEDHYRKHVGSKDKIIVALDALTLAHLASTFEWANGPHKR